MPNTLVAALALLSALLRLLATELLADSPSTAMVAVMSTLAAATLTVTSARSTAAAVAKAWRRLVMADAS